MDHLSLLHQMGLDEYVRRDIIRLIQCRDAQAELGQLIRHLEEKRRGSD